MASQPSLLVNAAVLLREPGTQQHITHTVSAADVDAGHPSITGDLVVDVELVSSLDDIVVSGTIDVPWHGICRRCLEPLSETLRIDVDERYADSPELIASGDALPIVRGQFDLTGMVRDEVLLAVDEERLCRDDCAGLCPTCGRDLNAGSCDCAAPVADNRWSALDQLRRPD